MKRENRGAAAAEPDKDHTSDATNAANETPLHFTYTLHFTHLIHGLLERLLFLEGLYH